MMNSSVFFLPFHKYLFVWPQVDISLRMYISQINSHCSLFCFHMCQLFDKLYDALRNLKRNWLCMCAHNWRKCIMVPMPFSSPLLLSVIPLSTPRLSLGCVLSGLVPQVVCLPQQMMWLGLQWPGHLFTHIYICVTLSCPSLYFIIAGWPFTRGLHMRSLLRIFQQMS